MSYKLYILDFRARFSFYNLVKFPLKGIIQLFTWSNSNHSAYTYNYKACGAMINQATSHGFESINYKKCLKDRDAKVYAYEINFPINFKLLHSDTILSRGAKYAKFGAIYSAIDNTRILKYLVKKGSDAERKRNETFCSAATFFICIKKQIIELIKESIVINSKYEDILNTNKEKITPKELKKYIEKNKLFRRKIKVWDGKKIINNIWEKS